MARTPIRRKRRIPTGPIKRRRFIPIPPKVDKKNQIAAALTGVEAQRSMSEDWRPTKATGFEADSGGGPPGTIPASSIVTTTANVPATKLYNRRITIDPPLPGVKLISLKLNEVVLVGGDGCGSEAFRGDVPALWALQFGNAKELRGAATLSFTWRNTNLVATNCPSIDLAAIDASCNGGRDDAPVPSYVSSQKMAFFMRRTRARM